MCNFFSTFLVHFRHIRAVWHPTLVCSNKRPPTPVCYLLHQPGGMMPPSLTHELPLAPQRPSQRHTTVSSPTVAPQHPQVRIVAIFPLFLTYMKYFLRKKKPLFIYKFSYKGNWSKKIYLSWLNVVLLNVQWFNLFQNVYLESFYTLYYKSINFVSMSSSIYI